MTFDVTLGPLYLFLGAAWVTTCWKRRELMLLSSFYVNFHYAYGNESEWKK